MDDALRRRLDAVLALLAVAVSLLAGLTFGGSVDQRTGIALAALAAFAVAAAVSRTVSAGSVETRETD